MIHREDTVAPCRSSSAHVLRETADFFHISCTFRLQLPTVPVIFTKKSKFLAFKFKEGEEGRAFVDETTQENILPWTHHSVLIKAT